MGISKANAELLLGRLLVLLGVVLASATIPMIFPVSWMAEIHRSLGLGEFPTDPIVVYLARSTSMLYAFHGCILIYCGLNLMTTRGLVPLIVILHLFSGVFLIWTDVNSPLPWFWILGEGPGIIFGAVVLGYLYWKSAD
ncbi:MAG: hypothetical protein R3C03_20915 [Pirellulaceae bacterium]